ncbi:MAG: helix-turn-helix transcriptional regulator, partial [Bacteroidales bacterium]|nr:helix-turn-helix transcriptional regulator [Bacteroidales bacterium]
MKPGRPARSAQCAFGKRLQILRESAKLTQQEIAAALGISQPSYALWERRSVSLSAEQVRKLAAVLGVDTGDLFSLDEDRPRRGKGPVGRARKTFEALCELPRNRQKEILDVVDIFINSHRLKARSNGKKEGGRHHGLIELLFLA